MRGHDLFRSVALVAALLCYSTILLGGTVMASGDGLGCPHWPTCYANDNLAPHVQGAAEVEWSHRVSAFFLGCAVLALSVLGMLYERQRRILLGLSFAALGLVVGEALLIAMLSNLREMPRRWVEWARRAAEESPPPATAGATAPTPAPGPFRLPREG